MKRLSRAGEIEEALSCDGPVLGQARLITETIVIWWASNLAQFEPGPAGDFGSDQLG